MAIWTFPKPGNSCTGWRKIKGNSRAFKKSIPSSCMTFLMLKEPSLLSMDCCFRCKFNVEMNVFEVLYTYGDSHCVPKQFSVFVPGTVFDGNYFWELNGASCLVWQILVAMYNCLWHLLCLKMTIAEVLANYLGEKKHIWNSLQSWPKRNSNNSDIFS